MHETASPRRSLTSRILKTHEIFVSEDECHKKRAYLKSKVIVYVRYRIGVHILKIKATVNFTRNAFLTQRCSLEQNFQTTVQMLVKQKLRVIAPFSLCLCDFDKITTGGEVSGSGSGVRGGGVSIITSVLLGDYGQLDIVHTAVVAVIGAVVSTPASRVHGRRVRTGVLYAVTAGVREARPRNSAVGIVTTCCVVWVCGRAVGLQRKG